MVDPHTPHVFDGEEFNRAARFFTHGYDIYTPNHVYVLHDYHKSQSNPIMHTWAKNKGVHGTFQESNKRLRTMLDMPGGEEDPTVALRMKQSKYGLGDRRTLDQLINFSGFDLRHEKISIDGKNRCGNIQWVPFVEHPKGVNYIPRFDEESEDPLEPYDPTSIWYEGNSPEVLPDYVDKGDDDENGVPANMNLDEKHAELQEDVEAAEVAGGDLAEKHKTLLEGLEEVEGDSEGTDVEGDIEGPDVEAESGAQVSEEYEAENEESEEDVATEELKLPQQQEERLRRGPLRKMKDLKEKAHHGAEAISGFIAKHPLPGGKKIEHGFSNLPTFVKVNVFLLVFGFIIAIRRSSRTGRALKRKDKKRDL